MTSKTSTISKVSGIAAGTAVGIMLAIGVTHTADASGTPDPLCQYDRTGSKVYVFGNSGPGTAVVKIPGPNPRKRLTLGADPAEYGPNYGYAKFRLPSRSTKVSAVIVRFDNGTSATCERT